MDRLHLNSSSVGTLGPTPANQNPHLLLEGETNHTNSATTATLSMEERQQRVQRKFKKRHYGTHQTKNPRRPFYIGQWVQHKLPPGTYYKGQTPLSRPFQVTEILGRWKYRLSNNTVGNARKLNQYNPRIQFRSQDEDTEEEFFPPDVPRPRAPVLSGHFP
ncbi:MAG: hypothetical protein GY696_08220, partial [Gammaproteobacteria bacterium]|nr:hypothetical protein [Gammaproteobacteria bacterium]